MIIKNGNQWILKSKDGKKVLGKHSSEKSALAQERAININKSQKGKRK